MEPRNQFQGMTSASLCSLAGRYDNRLPPRFLAPIDSLKIPALVKQLLSLYGTEWRVRGYGLGVWQCVHAVSSGTRKWSYFGLCFLLDSEWCILHPDPYPTLKPVLRIRIRMFLGPPGSGSICQRYGSGSFYHQAKIVRKTLILTVLRLLCYFFYFKNDLNEAEKLF